jgi:MFS family permease
MTSAHAPFATGPLAPLGVKIFRWLWLAGLVSNIGGWMQTVGAQWFLVEQQASPALVALVSTASAAPVLLFGIPAGVLGEFANRRVLLIWVQTVQALFALALALVTALGLMTPSLLLALTFGLGVAAAVQLPAYQAIVPEIVPTRLIADAASLSSIGVNVARAIGPALAGLIVGSLGIPFVFALNALSFAAFLLVLIVWRDYRRPEVDREPFWSATRAGLRYVQHAGVVRRMYLQLLLFIIPANALWALLPVLASDRLGLDSSGYGLLLAALGVGSIAGAFVIPAARARLGTNRLIVVVSVAYGVGIAAIALSPSLLITIPVLIVIGLAWIGVIATLNGAVQSFLPRWVRTRGLSVYQLVFFGGTAAGSALSGLLGEIYGTVTTMVAAGAIVAAASCLLLVRPLLSTDKSRESVPMPLTDVPPVQLPEPADGMAETDSSDDISGRRTLVLVRYGVTSANRDAFIAAMAFVEQSRRRTGARTWDLYDDRERPGILVEAYTVGSWQEHLSQHQSRTTGYDSAVSQNARRLASSEPVIEHLISVGNMPKVDRLGTRPSPHAASKGEGPSSSSS